MGRSPCSQFAFAFASLAVIGCATGSREEDDSASTTDVTTTTGGGAASAGPSSTTGNPSGTGSDSATTTSGSGTGGGGGAGGSGSECSPAEGGIFVISKTNDLHRFDPTSAKLKLVGPLMCQVSAGVIPVSIAVDRQELAWVLYSDRRLYKVSTASAACEKTAFVPSQHGFSTFSLAFVANAPDFSSETLTIANNLGTGSIDMGTLVVTPHGTFGTSQTLQLTGTGKGELYGFFTTKPAYLSPIDKLTAAIGAHLNIDAIKTTGPSAFAQWGGSFWFFTAPIGTSSRIDRYDPIAKTISTINASVGFEIVAAGVSTCAPTK